MAWWRRLGALPFVVFVLTGCNALYIGSVALRSILDLSVTSPTGWMIGAIVWDVATTAVLVAALVCWIVAVFKREHGFDTARALSTIGLLMIVVVFFAGVIAMGGEWSGMDPAFRNSVLAAITLVLIHTTSQAWVRNRHGEGATGPVDVK